MATITIVGGTGYTGANIAREAIDRDHRVRSFSRHAPHDPVDGVDYHHGTSAEATTVVVGSDVVVATLSPRGDTAGTVLHTYQALADAAVTAGARLVVIGGFSSLRPEDGAPRFVEGELDDQVRGEATEMESVRVWLTTDAPAELDWTFVSPAGAYGAWAAGKRTGSYRLGGEVALFDANGGSEISGPDFAVAVVDEIEAHAHPREHIGIAY